jgi:signal peptidase I
MIAEPFVIPSGSMIPTLHVHDHILVNKLAYGLHVPFSKKWIFQWASPRRGDIVVFRYPENPDVFYVKRAIGLGGDRVTMEHGTLVVNGEKLPIERSSPSTAVPADEDSFEYFAENGHLIRYRDQYSASFEEITVPEGKIFVLGDNRDQSNDSRFWGFVPEENLIGRAWLIWLACDATLPSAQFLCDPTTLRWDRVFLLPK